MKVKELIEELQKLHPEKEILIFDEKNDERPSAMIMSVEDRCNYSIMITIN
jgi:hypothetical protein